MIGQLTILIVRLYGISLLIQALGVLYRGGTFIGTVWNGAVSGIAGLAIIFAAPMMARLILKDAAKDNISVTDERLVQAGAFLIGLYWVVASLPRAITQTNFILNTSPDVLGALSGSNVTEQLWSTTLEAWGTFAVGLFLILGIRHASRLFRWSSEERS